MASYYVSYFFFIAVFGVQMLNMEEFNHTATKLEILKLMKSERVQENCRNRDELCKMNETTICAVRMIDNVTQYKDFENSCFFIFYNLCDDIESYSIAGSSSCSELRATRRIFVAKKQNNNKKVNNNKNIQKLKNPAAMNGTKTLNNSTQELKKKQIILRTGKIAKNLTRTFDNKPCPISCPNIYDPVCMVSAANRGNYTKVMSFVNQCECYLYYCKHINDTVFAQPPRDSVKYAQVETYVEKVFWTRCANPSYSVFVRMSLEYSTMQKHGWLYGNHKYNHIMTPNERSPLYG